MLERRGNDRERSGLFAAVSVRDAPVSARAADTLSVTAAVGLLPALSERDDPTRKHSTKKQNIYIDK